MLHPHLPLLNARKVVLASASPRRQDLLGKQLGLRFEVVVSAFEELLPKEDYRGQQGAARYAVHTAQGKVLDVYHTLRTTRSEVPDLLIGADTVVELDGEILEKPDDAASAHAMLSRLSNSTHHVHTGVVLAMPPEAADTRSAAAPALSDPYLHAFSCTTTVEFDALSDEVIRAYIASGEPYGKAGSYGIQGIAGSFVRRLDGCFFNVVGFPLNRFATEVLGLIQHGKLRL